MESDSGLWPLNAIAITGLGIVSPIGIGPEEVWASILNGKSGVQRIQAFDAGGLPVQIAGEVRGFNATDYVRPKKSLKLMSRDAQLGVAASIMACEMAGLPALGLDAGRIGVIFAADRISGGLDEGIASYEVSIADGRFSMELWASKGMSESFPLSFLKVLPNMVACHISIACDAQGPNNTIHHGEVSGLLALAEAASILCRNRADFVIAGGTSARIRPYDWVGLCGTDRLSTENGDPAQACRPFDRRRTGQVIGEGAGAVVLERLSGALERQGPILGLILGTGCAHEPGNRSLPTGSAVIRAAHLALSRAGVSPDELAFVHAHGLGSIREDMLEASWIHRVAPGVPVVGLKGYLGNLGAAAGVVEAAISVLGLRESTVPATLNCCEPEGDCLVNIAKVPSAIEKSKVLIIQWTHGGQAAAVVLSRWPT